MSVAENAGSLMDSEQEPPLWRSLDRCRLTTEEAAEYL